MSVERPEAPLYARGLFQIAYATRDLQAAMRLFGARYGISNYHVLRDLEFLNGARLHIALAWSGRTMVEFVQTLDATPSVFQSLQPAEGQLMRQHHLGHLIDDADAWEQVLRGAHASGQAVVARGHARGVNFFFLDAREELGHFLEYIHLEGEARRLFDAVPHQ